MANVYAFDVDDCMESGGQLRLPPTNGPVKWQDLRKLAKKGHIVGICGNWENVWQVVPDWRDFLSFMEPQPHPGAVEKWTRLVYIRNQYPGYANYIMVGNNPGKHADRPDYWDDLYPKPGNKPDGTPNPNGGLPVTHIPGQSLLSNDIGAAQKAGWQFIAEDDFANGQRIGSIPKGHRMRINKVFGAGADCYKVTNAEAGIVEGIYSATGNEDRQGDVIEPGAYSRWLGAVQKGEVDWPNLCWSHDWEAPTGKVLDIAELPPGDPRLPESLRNKGMGGLWAKVQYNLDTQRGKEAFSDVKFGAVRQRSIGFDIDGEAKSFEVDSKGVRHIKSIFPLYEISDVLVGANPATPLMAVKSATPTTATPRPSKVTVRITAESLSPTEYKRAVKAARKKLR